ncbi:MAG: amidohydrolase [Phycisphaerales bacterium]|nr:amidohydrolase [Planctomycetota bacterium]
MRSGQKKWPAALREAHAHLPWLGKALGMTSLEGCRDRREALERIARAAETAGKGGWVLAHSARVSTWSEGRWFERSELDRVTGDRPAAVMSFDHHAVFANSAALKKAGIDSARPDPAGGVIARDSRGEPTGLLLESAAFEMWGMAPEPTPAQWAQLIPRAVSHLAGFGYREVHDLFAPRWLGPLLAGMHDRGELPLSVGLFAPLQEIESQADESRTWQRPGVQLLGGKIFTDGTLSSRTASMLEPFADAPLGLERGKPLMSAHEIRAAVERCDRAGVGIAMHAIGDAAVRTCLDGIAMLDAAIRRKLGASRKVRIEHCEIVAREDVRRFAELGAVASVQPCHLLSDIETLRACVPDRLDRVMPWRDLIDNGLRPGETLLFGSDVPVVGADPEDSVQAATFRGRKGDTVSIGSGQAISHEEAAACFSCEKRALDDR